MSHPLHMERFGIPGKTLRGSDSHTTAAGSLGMLAIGAGRITLPDGTTVKSNDSNANSILSGALGKEVRFISKAPDEPQLEQYWPDIEELDYRYIITDEDMPKGTFYDLAIVHLLTPSMLDDLRRLYPEGR